MRLIDADAFKEDILSGLYIYCQENKEDIANAIDNAPSVPMPDFKEGYKQAIIDGKTNYSRQKGEWGEHGECPFCSYIRQWEEDNFCGNCGADLRKGGAE